MTGFYMVTSMTVNRSAIITALPHIRFPKDSPCGRHSLITVNTK